MESMIVGGVRLAVRNNPGPREDEFPSMWDRYHLRAISPTPSPIILEMDPPGDSTIYLYLTDTNGDPLFDTDFIDRGLALFISANIRCSWWNNVIDSQLGRVDGCNTTCISLGSLQGGWEGLVGPYSWVVVDLRCEVHNASYMGRPAHTQSRVQLPSVQRQHISKTFLFVPLALPEGDDRAGSPPPGPRREVTPPLSTNEVERAYARAATEDLSCPDYDGLENYLAEVARDLDDDRPLGHFGGDMELAAQDAEEFEDLRRLRKRSSSIETREIEENYAREEEEELEGDEGLILDPEPSLAPSPIKLFQESVFQPITQYFSSSQQPDPSDQERTQCQGGPERRTGRVSSDFAFQPTPVAKPVLPLVPTPRRGAGPPAGGGTRRGYPAVPRKFEARRGRGGSIWGRLVSSFPSWFQHALALLALAVVLDLAVGGVVTFLEVLRA